MKTSYQESGKYCLSGIYTAEMVTNFLALRRNGLSINDAACASTLYKYPLNEHSSLMPTKPIRRSLN
jgi:hypothetical protein